MYSRYPLAKFERLSFLRPRIRMWNHWMNEADAGNDPVDPEDDADQDPVNDTDEQFEPARVVLEHEELLL